MSQNLLLLAAVAAGALLPVQAGINAMLAGAVGPRLLASLISFVIGTVCLVLLCLALRPPLPDSAALAKLPWFGWIGGALGAVYVTSLIFLAPKLGATALLGAIVFGQVVVSLILDHFGLLGFALTRIDGPRLLGALLLLAGVLLVRR